MARFNMREWKRIRANNHIAWYYKTQFENELEKVTNIQSFAEWFARVNKEYRALYPIMAYTDILNGAYIRLMKQAENTIFNIEK